MPRALVVDDDHTLCTLVVQILRHAGYESVEANNGLEALDILGKDAHFDVILSDIQMPQIDGTKLLGELRRHYPHIPVIVFSVNSNWAWAPEMIRQGAAQYLPKPFNRQQLLDAVHTVTRSAGLDVL